MKAKPLPPIVTGRQVAGYALGAAIYAPIIVGGLVLLSSLVNPNVIASGSVALLVAASLVVYVALFVVQLVVGVLEPKSKGLGFGTIFAPRHTHGRTLAKAA